MGQFEIVYCQDIEKGRINYLQGELRPTLQKKPQLRLKTKTLQLTNLLKRKVIILHINSQTTENKGRKKMAAHLQASSRNVIGD